MHEVGSITLATNPLEDMYDGDRLYELTHDMTAEFVELYEHERNCTCPLCSGDPDA